MTLVERTALGAGASGRNSGVVQHPFDPVLIALHLETLDLYRGLGEDGMELGATPVGLLSVTLDPAVAREQTTALEASHPTLDPTYVGPGEATAIEPALSPAVAACRLEMGYPVEPMAAVRAYGRRAERHGVEILLGTAAQPALHGERVRGVDLADGTRIDAEHVVVAAGPWTSGLVDPTGRWAPIRPLWGVDVALTLADPPRHVLEEAGIEIAPDRGPSPAAGHEDRPPSPDDHGLSFSLVTADGRSSLGSTFLHDEPDPSRFVPAVVERGARFVPGIKNVERGATRLCARPLSEDGRPLIGRAPGIEGLWMAAGHGPWGISTGPASGRLLTDLVNGRVAAPPPELDPARF